MHFSRLEFSEMMKTEENQEGEELDKENGRSET